MCGISGFYNYSPRSSFNSGQVLARMTNSMGHRGPDDNGCMLFDRSRGLHSFFASDAPQSSGILEKGNVGLGHRRLSILDLSQRGRQPIGDEEQQVWLTYNGEVYNYLELKKELEQHGHKFSTSTDTEVVLKSYLQWGEECFKRFNGMWGLAIYDKSKEIMILSRDRFGKKPLYYYQDKDNLYFASEIKALLQHPSIQPEINLKKITNYAGRHYRYVDDDNESFFQGIKQVPPSSYLVFKLNGTKEEEKYWHLYDQPCISISYSEREIVERFKALLNDAVRIRLRSDVPLGSMLSGGMDSSSITCLATKFNSRFRAFSGVTGDGYYDESQYIDSIVKATGISHTYVYPGADNLFATLREMLHFHDEPVCTVTWYCNYLLTKKIAEFGIPVILTGHGGDELLAGYWDHYHYFFNDLREAGHDDLKEHQAWLKNHNRSEEEYVRERKYIEKLRHSKKIEIQKYSQYLDCLSPGLRDKAVKKSHHTPFSNSLSRRLFLELHYETIPPSLRAEDRNMMAFSIENRVPLLDYRLTEFCFRLPNKYKIRGGLGKWLLREATKGLLPEDVRTRKDKTGFNAPFDQWIRNENRQQLEGLINSKSFINSEIYNQRKVKETFQAHLEGENHYMFFWQYLNLCLWHEMFFK